MRLVVVSAAGVLAHARATVRSALEHVPGCVVDVLDLDGSYVAVGVERVARPGDVGIGSREHHARAALLDPAQLLRWAQPALVSHALESAPVVLTAAVGVIFHADPVVLLDLAAQHGVGLVARRGRRLPEDDAYPGPEDLIETGSSSPDLLAVGHRGRGFLEVWQRLAGDPLTASQRCASVAAGLFPHGSVRAPHFLVSAWTDPATRFAAGPHDGTLAADGALVVATDLSLVDPAVPWLLAPEVGRHAPRLRLSAHPHLADLVARYAAEVRADSSGLGQPSPTLVSSVGVEMHAQLRSVFRQALDESPLRSIDDLPDAFDPDRSDAFTSWLVEPAPDGGDLGVGRYLASIYRSRPDLRCVYPEVPGTHTQAFLTWADRHGRHEAPYSAALIDLTLRLARPDEGSSRPPRSGRARPPGVNVVGYLTGELGVGESARHMLDALEVGGVPNATVSVSNHLQSRRGAAYDARRSSEPFDTTLLCVNADQIATVAASVPAVVAGSYRIGMWYWEVEDFPAAQHAAFSEVDEVWVATDFVRRAIEPHSPVPVRTITPPLPQPRASVDPTIVARTRADLGLPERPTFLFSFDYLSTVERKNPWGLLDAFQTAFAPGEGPVLVIKSINADLRVAEAERLRLRVGAAPDVVLLEDYLDARDRDALMASCDCYVSLHRSEGLGLTMAEAMAFGKPVIATGYSGNLQFMTEANSFLVPWSPAAIPPGCEPYPAGGTWAEPDTEAAAQLMRSVLDDGALAAARGRQAAADLGILHSPEVAGRRIAARLTELEPARRARGRTGLRAHLAAVVERSLRR